MRRTVIFWDFSNFDVTLKDLVAGYPRSVRFEFEKFVEHLIKDTELIKVYFATSSPEPEPVGMRSFFDAIDRKPFFYVKIFRRSLNAGRSSEKQVDTYLATQMVALAYENAYDIAILISGDVDYLPAVEIVQQKGKVVSVVSASRNLSEDLKMRADRYTLVDKQGEAHFQHFLVPQTQ